MQALRSHDTHTHHTTVYEVSETQVAVPAYSMHHKHQMVDTRLLPCVGEEETTSSAVNHLHWPITTIFYVTYRKLYICTITSIKMCKGTMLCKLSSLLTLLDLVDLKEPSEHGPRLGVLLLVVDGAELGGRILHDGGGRVDDHHLPPRQLNSVVPTALGHG